MTRMMQNKETIKKFQGICTEELLYTSDEFRVKAKNIKIYLLYIWSNWPKTYSENSMGRDNAVKNIQPI